MDVLKDILDRVSDSVIVVSPPGQIMLFNTEAARIQKSISDKPLELGAYLTDLAGGDRRKALADVLKAVKKQRKPTKSFVECKTQFGTSIFLEVNFIPVLAKNGRLRYINIITQDVTNRKIFEQKVKAVNADVSNLLEQAHAFILSVDSQGYIVECNKYCTTLTGYDKKDILSQKVCDVLLTEAGIPEFDSLMERIRAGESVGSFRLPIRTNKNAELVIMLSATPRVNANGKVIGATLVGQDVTELMEYRQSLENQIKNKTAAIETVLKKEKEAIEMKTRLVSMASHEFRSPLSSIDYAANFIKQNAATIGKKKLNEKVQTIEKHVSYMSHLLDDVLNYSRNEAANIKVVPTQLCLKTFIANTIEEVMCQCKRSHKVCLSSNDLGSLFTDEKLFRNILINLLTNAIKFSPGRDEVFLNVLDKGPFVQLEVRDDGIGIPEDEIEKIFEPFVRGKAVDTIQGTGLGLSIVQKAASLLQGSVYVESRPGKGSTFKVIIPRQMAFL